MGVRLNWQGSFDVRAVAYEITASIVGQAYRLSVGSRTIEEIYDERPVVGDIVTYSIVAIRDDGLRSEPTVIVHTVTGEGLESPSAFEVVSITGNNGLAQWVDSNSSTVSGGEVRVGDNWRNSAFLSSSANSPIPVDVTGFDYLTYLLAFHNPELVYSEPETAEASPLPDWFNQSYTVESFRFSDTLEVDHEVNAVIHPTGAIVPSSSVLASSQGWETFDYFVEQRQDCELSFAEVTVSDTQIVEIGALVFTTLPEYGYPDRGLTPADVDLAIWVKNGGNWGSAIIITKEYTQYVGVSGDESMRLGFVNDKTSGIFTTDILYRVAKSVI